jgi:hypothetical protein
MARCNSPALVAREARDRPSPSFSLPSRAFEKFFQKKREGEGKQKREGMQDHALHAPHALKLRALNIKQENKS